MLSSHPNLFFENCHKDGADNVWAYEVTDLSHWLLSPRAQILQSTIGDSKKWTRISTHTIDVKDEIH